MKKDTFILNTDLDEKTETLADEEVGKVFRKILKYVKDEELPKLDKHLEMVFSFIKVDLDKNLKKYQEKCEKNKQIAQKRWEEKNAKAYECIQTHTNDADNDNEYDNDNDIISNEIIKKEIKTKKKFIKPTIEEVDCYCKERNNKVNAERFIDYYEANGWKVGKNSMKDWKAAIRTWEKNDGNFSNRPVFTKQEQLKPKWFDKQSDMKKPNETELREMEKFLEELEE